MIYLYGEENIRVTSMWTNWKIKEENRWKKNRYVFVGFGVFNSNVYKALLKLF